MKIVYTHKKPKNLAKLMQLSGEPEVSEPGSAARDSPSAPAGTQQAPKKNASQRRSAKRMQEFLQKMKNKAADNAEATDDAAMEQWIHFLKHCGGLFILLVAIIIIIHANSSSHARSCRSLHGHRLPFLPRSLIPPHAEDMARDGPILRGIERVEDDEE